MSEEILNKITENYRIPTDLFDYIPKESAENYKVIPISFKNGVLTAAALNPEDISVRDALNFISSHQQIEYKLVKIDEKIFEKLLSQYTQSDVAVVEALEQIDTDEGIILGVDEETKPDEDFVKEEAPVIKLVSSILNKGVGDLASDIHIEPSSTNSVVRFRTDGALKEVLVFPKKVHNPLVARIKILSNLKLDEKRKPQDGRFGIKIQNRKVDFRVSTFPIAEGEKISLRVLDKQSGLISLGDLGLSLDGQQKILNAINRPYGLILATGPTGAGKTTTLYSILSNIDRKSKNIVSLEDPIEYTLDGINQSNIKPEIGYDFASGLRSVLRGDPDQIFVGEIRDKETAQLAVQAALTGHVVFSTLHTNTAIGAVTRLINFGIDPFLLAPTLSLIIGQRMAKKIAGEYEEKPFTKSLEKQISKIFETLPEEHRKNLPEFKSFKEVKPTTEFPTGTSGRIGVFEILDINDSIKNFIFENAKETQIAKAARESGMLTMGEDAIVKGLEGKIPYSEVLKINGENSMNQIDLEDDEIETDK